MRDADGAREYYRTVAEPVLRHVHGYTVLVSDVDARPSGHRRVGSLEDLDELAASGGVGLAVHTDARRIDTEPAAAGYAGDGRADAARRDGEPPGESGTGGGAVDGTRLAPAADATDHRHRANRPGRAADGLGRMADEAALDRTDRPAPDTAARSARAAWWVRPGAGADVAVAATAALALSEDPAGGGARWVAMTDGSDGLVLVAVWASTDGPADIGEFAAAAARRLADRAPEIATTDPAVADGRAFIDTRPSDPGGTIPVPYSLAPPGTDNAVVPLTLDELAAITAGMPAEFGAGDLPNRIALHGDLAAPLAPPH